MTVLWKLKSSGKKIGQSYDYWAILMISDMQNPEWVKENRNAILLFE
jgi:hypothetical protein